MKTRIFRRSLIAAGLLLAGVIAAPAAFARSHVSIGLGFYSPGVNVGVNNGYGYYGPAYYQGYYNPAPVYYSPAYYDPAPVYYDPYPAYGTVYYSSGYYGGGYYGGGYYHHDRDHWRGRDRDDRRWHDHDHDHDGGWHH